MYRKGILKAFDSGTYKADVQLIGSLNTYLTGIPTNRGIPSAQMTAGRYVSVLAIDDGNPADMVVTAVWT